MKKSFSKVLISIYSLIAFQTPQGVLAESDVFEKCNKLDDAIEFRESSKVLDPPTDPLSQYETIN